MKKNKFFAREVEQNKKNNWNEGYLENIKWWEKNREKNNLCFLVSHIVGDPTYNVANDSKVLLPLVLLILFHSSKETTKSCCGYTTTGFYAVIYLLYPSRCSNIECDNFATNSVPKLNWQVIGHWLIYYFVLFSFRVVFLYCLFILL